MRLSITLNGLNRGNQNIWISLYTILFKRSFSISKRSGLVYLEYTAK